MEVFFLVNQVHWPTMIDSLMNQINEFAFHRSSFHIKIDQFQLSKSNFFSSQSLHFARKKPLGRWQLTNAKISIENREWETKETKDERIQEACQIISWRITETTENNQKKKKQSQTFRYPKSKYEIHYELRFNIDELRTATALQKTTLSWTRITIRYSYRHKKSDALSFSSQWSTSYYIMGFDGIFI